MLNPSHRRAGFTLLELMITLAVAAILVTVAVPSMSRLIRESQASASINDFVYALRLARSEAVTRKLPVAVCASAGDECTTDNDWQKGWLVFTDPDEDEQCVDAGGRDCEDAGRILHRVTDVSADFTLSATDGSNPERLGVVVYDLNGFASGYPTTFTLCDETGKVGPRGFTLSMSGRIDTEVAGLSCD